jgi:hypothetical protein
MAMPGSKASFKVQAEGREISTVYVRPCSEATGYKVQFAGRGIEAPAQDSELTLTIEVPDQAAMA